MIFNFFYMSNAIIFYTKVGTLVVNLKCVVSISYVSTFKFKDKCLIPTPKEFTRGVSIQIYSLPRSTRTNSLILNATQAISQSDLNPRL